VTATGITTVTTETSSVSISEAINADVALNKEAKQSGATVAGAIDNFFGKLNWTAYKGNKSAATCGMSKDEFRAVKEVRVTYKNAWEAAGLKNFDQRWQYVVNESTHYVAPTTSETASKSPEQKAAEHARGLFRQAVEMEDHELEEIARDACGRLGIEIQSEE
jgi:hypothetical protein